MEGRNIVGWLLERHESAYSAMLERVRRAREVYEADKSWAPAEKAAYERSIADAAIRSREAANAVAIQTTIEAEVARGVKRERQRVLRDMAEAANLEAQHRRGQLLAMPAVPFLPTFERVGPLLVRSKLSIRTDSPMKACSRRSSRLASYMLPISSCVVAPPSLSISLTTSVVSRHGRL